MEEDSHPRRRPLGFLDLPVEIRLQVYEHYLMGRDPLDRRFELIDWVKVDVQTQRILVRPHFWPLFETCRAVYAEVMPEYYARKEFHFTSLVDLRQLVGQHPLFRRLARRVVLNPQFTYPTVDDLLSVDALRQFVVANIACHRPAEGETGDPLSHAVLKQVLDAHRRMYDAKQLCDAVAETEELRRRGVHLQVRFTYSYREKSAQSGVWGEGTKRRRVIDYDFADDTFQLLQPDEGERSLITPWDV